MSSKHRHLSACLPPVTILLAALCVVLPVRAEDKAEASEAPEPAPRIMNIEPITGPAQGGGTVTVLGQNFRENALVFFGDERSPEVKVERQGTVLTVKPPPGEGTVDVRVVNPDKQEAKKESAFYYGSGVPAKVFQLRHGLRELGYWIHLGGSIMYPIIFLSFVALALIIHCLFTISEEHLVPRRLVEDVAEYLANGQWDNAAEYCRKKGCAFGRIMLAGLQKADQPAEVIRETVASAGARETERLFQKVNWLNSIGVISPMLGLFGTVWGLQLAFQAIAGAGAQHQVLAGAIAVALNTTVAGLFVAIPAFLGYFWFRGKIVRLVGTMEVLAEEMAERIISRKGDEE